MLKVIGCVTQTHDLRLVLVAVIICGMACFTTLHMLSRVEVASGWLRRAWVIGAGVAFGCGVWTMHFVAMLAFRPGVPTGYGVTGTVISLLLAIGLAVPALALFAGVRTRLVIGAAGALLGTAIGSMHYVGMSALRVPAAVRYDVAFVALSLAIGLGVAIAGLEVARRRHRAAAAGLLTLAICGLHFVGMTAVSLEPLPIEPAVSAFPAGALAVTVTASTLLILMLSLVGSFVDERATNRLADEAARYRWLADQTFEGILFHENGVIRDVNLALCRMSGFATESLIGSGIERLGLADLLIADEDDASVLEVALRTADGALRPVELLSRAVRGSNGHFVWALRDVSDRKAAEREIERLAHYDPLTGLANRRLFNDRLGQALATAIRSGSSIALFCLDLDHFKRVNELMGHAAADRILRQVGDRIKSSLRETDTAARLGADEFAIIQPMTWQPEATAALTRRLVDELARPYMIDDRHVSLSVSIGIALAPSDGTDAAELMRSADLALSRAKTQRRGGFCFFEPETDSRLKQRRELENELAQALVRNQLRLHYQPLFDATGLGLVGFEALLRWVHPMRGPISPAEFIPIAEESGLIVPIGTWVLETACAKAASWPRPLRIAVNLSPVQFDDDGLVAAVERALRRHDLPPGRLELEITEGVLINDVEGTLATLRSLKALGVVIALDDFGTGYSSLSYLRRFPFDKIKIDRSFVQGLGEDEDAEAIVQSIIAMGRSLKLAVTAEGVETAAQLDLLRDLQCSEVQGFLLGRPMAEPTIGHVPAAQVSDRRGVRPDTRKLRSGGTAVIQNNRVRSLGEEQPAFHE